MAKQNNLLTLTSFLNFPLYFLFFLPTKALRRKHKSTLTHVNMLVLAHKQTLLSIFAFSWTRQFFFLSPFPVCKLPFSSFHSHTHTNENARTWACTWKCTYICMYTDHSSTHKHQTLTSTFSLSSIKGLISLSHKFFNPLTTPFVAVWVFIYT